MIVKHIDFSFYLKEQRSTFDRADMYVVLRKCNVDFTFKHWGEKLHQLLQSLLFVPYPMLDVYIRCFNSN